MHLAAPNVSCSAWEGGQLDFLKSFFNAPSTPAGQTAALLVAILSLVLCGPLLVDAVGSYLWPFVLQQYGADLAPIVYVGIWIIAFPALLALLRGSLASSFGMAAMYMVDKFI